MSRASTSLSRWRAWPTVCALALGALAAAACAERVTEPVVPHGDTADASVESIAIRDVVERVVPSLADAVLTGAVTQAFAQLRRDLDAGRLSDAASSLQVARMSLHSVRASDDGTITADLTVIELALDDASAKLRAASAARDRRQWH